MSHIPVSYNIFSNLCLIRIRVEQPLHYGLPVGGHRFAASFTRLGCVVRPLSQAFDTFTIWVGNSKIYSEIFVKGLFNINKITRKTFEKLINPKPRCYSPNCDIFKIYLFMMLILTE